MPADLPALVAATKTLPTTSTWQVIDRQGWMKAVWPLDIDGVTVQGLRLRGTAKRDLPDEAVTFQLEYVPPQKGSGRGGALWRIEWRPLKAHDNKGHGPPELRFKLQSDSHHHPFDLNWGEMQKYVRRGNLPIAVPFPPDVEDTYEGLVAFMKEQFKIATVGRVPVPAWVGTLL